MDQKAKAEQLAKLLDKLVGDTKHLEENMRDENVRIRMKARLCVALMKTVSHEDAVYSLLKIVGMLMLCRTLSESGKDHAAAAALQAAYEAAIDSIGDPAALLEKMYGEAR